MSSFGNGTIGSKIRNVRKNKGQTLVALADETGFSKSYISQIERDMVSPSLSALKKIAAALQVSLGPFFDDGNSNSNNAAMVVPKNRRKVFTYSDSDVRHELLSPDLKHAIEFLWATAPSGAGSGDFDYVHDGEECGLVIKGRMEMQVGDNTYILEEGDAIYFKSSLPHRWKSIGSVPLEAVWAITPPSF